MNIPDLSPLIKGVLVIVGIAIAIGQYPRLEVWARSQAIGSCVERAASVFFPRIGYACTPESKMHSGRIRRERSEQMRTPIESFDEKNE